MLLNCPIQGVEHCIIAEGVCAEYFRISSQHENVWIAPEPKAWRMRIICTIVCRRDLQHHANLIEVLQFAILKSIVAIQDDVCSYASRRRRCAVKKEYGAVFRCGSDFRRADRCIDAAILRLYEGNVHHRRCG